VGRSVEGRVESGDLRVLTGSRLPGRRLRLRTEEGIAQLTGTAVSLYRDEHLTCVCVLEGVAEVGADEQDLEPIPAGMLKAMPVGGGDPVVQEVLDAHAGPLAEFARRYRRAVDGEADSSNRAR
jgi:ferric-dicitrate binding protein FerR (iron transport regulator)